MNTATGKKIVFFALLLVSIAAFVCAVEYIDVIYMRDGTVEKGTILGQVAGETITLKTLDGRTVTIQFKDIVKLAKEEVAETPAAPATADPGGNGSSAAGSAPAAAASAQPVQQQPPAQSQAAPEQSTPLPEASTEPAATQVTYQEIDALIRRGLRWRYATIYEKSRYLSPSDKTLLYQRHEKSGGAGFALNFFIGFGIGSFVQKDVGAGVAGLLLELFSTPIYVAGMVLSFTEDESFIPMAAVGGTVLMVNYLFQWIRPAAFAAKYNRRLKTALRLSESVGMMVVPAVNVETVSDKRGVPERRATYGVGALIRL